MPKKKKFSLFLPLKNFGLKRDGNSNREVSFLTQSAGSALIGVSTNPLSLWLPHKLFLNCLQ